jgi:cytochrome c oxidase cbb3-type subunit I
VSTAPTPSRADRVADAARHGLLWLVVGNALGLLLALLLLEPRLGELLTPWTYGRLMPLHLNVQLFGWCSLPLVALLFLGFLPADGRSPLAGVALHGWSAALALGAASWLFGATTAKPFLDWAGPARWVLLAELVLLEVALVVGWWQRTRPTAAARPGRLGRLRGWLTLALLATVPAALWVATRPEVYPPINPATGGPTGGSLLGSTLGIVAIFLLCPYLLDLTPTRPTRRAAWLSFGLFGLHALAFGLLDHGDHSHRELAQFAAVASLAVWPPVLWLWLRRFQWPAGSGRWLAAFAAWGTLLVGTAIATFLPGVLERLKFTNGLVAHAHLAMAGMVTSFLLLALVATGAGHGLGRPLAAARPFWLWNLGTLLHVGALLVAGWIEGGDLGWIVRGGAPLTVPYSLRAAAGALMLLASLEWLRGALAA